MRKYFEGQIVKFDPDFKPGMEFVQSLLKKVPIHVLPIWYSLPRLSNAIFESIVEKYLLTPQTFQRYLSDLTFSNPLFSSIVKDVYQSPQLKVDGQSIIEKYHLTREQFEEALLQLEFHLVCFLGYEKQDDQYKEIITPFQEWKDYVSFLKMTETPSIQSAEEIKRKRPQDFSFVQDLSILLKTAKKNPLPLALEKGSMVFSSDKLDQLAKEMGGFAKNDPLIQDYVHQLKSKPCQLKLASVVDGRFYALETASDFLEMSSDQQALFLYRHPLNRHLLSSLSSELSADRILRESEKSILRILSSGWVYFDDFIKGVIVPLNENSTITLKKQGKTWKYTIPSYSDEELDFIRTVVLEWLFEIGITAVGTLHGKECLCVTPFGQSLFGQ